MREHFVLRSDPDFLEWESFMRFRLHYEGPLMASKGDVQDGQNDRRAPHKHSLRRAFHRQLKHLWHTNSFLSSVRGGYDIFGIPRPEGYPERLADEPLLRDVIGNIFVINNRRFAPLVCKRFDLLCGLEVLLLRRDRPGGIIQGRDIDNRLKTLFDALKMPSNLSELAGCEFNDDEDPMFVLLQDDSLITQVKVETDDLLDPPAHAGADDSFVRLLVTVDLRAYNINMFNLSFGGG
jgi:hypothetical protein